MANSTAAGPGVSISAATGQGTDRYRVNDGYRRSVEVLVSTEHDPARYRDVHHTSLPVVHQVHAVVAGARLLSWNKESMAAYWLTFELARWCGLDPDKRDHRRKVKGALTYLHEIGALLYAPPTRRGGRSIVALPLAPDGWADPFRFEGSDADAELGIEDEDEDKGNAGHADADATRDASADNAGDASADNAGDADEAGDASEDDSKGSSCATEGVLLRHGRGPSAPRKGSSCATRSSNKVGTRKQVGRPEPDATALGADPDLPADHQTSGKSQEQPATADPELVGYLARAIPTAAIKAAGTTPERYAADVLAHPEHPALRDRLAAWHAADPDGAALDTFVTGKGDRPWPGKPGYFASMLDDLPPEPPAPVRATRTCAGCGTATSPDDPGPWCGSCETAPAEPDPSEWSTPPAPGELPILDAFRRRASTIDHNGGVTLV